jgi:hypothetical protein
MVQDQADLMMVHKVMQGVDKAEAEARRRAPNNPWGTPTSPSTTIPDGDEPLSAKPPPSPTAADKVPTPAQPDEDSTIDELPVKPKKKNNQARAAFRTKRRERAKAQADAMILNLATSRDKANTVTRQKHRDQKALALKDAAIIQRPDEGGAALHDLEDIARSVARQVLDQALDNVAARLAWDKDATPTQRDMSRRELYGQWRQGKGKGKSCTSGI